VAGVPLFVENRDELKLKVRLNGIPDSGGADAQLDEALSAVRVGFLMELGAARVAQLVAMTLNRNAVTEADMIRLLAAVTEVRWVLYEILATMTARFADGHSEPQTWNEERFLRDKTPELIDQWRDELWNQIQEALGILSTGEVSEETGWNVSLIGPDFVNDPPPRPGETLFLPEASTLQYPLNQLVLE